MSVIYYENVNIEKFTEKPFSDEKKWKLTFYIWGLIYLRSFPFRHKHLHMNTQEAKQIPITDLLAAIGAQPKHSRKNGDEIWYLSPFRDGETKPSFKITVSFNSWYDFGLGGMWHDGSKSGGNVIDFAMQHQRTDNLSEALAWLDGLGISTAFKPRLFPSAKPGRPTPPKSSKKTTLKKVKPLEHRALIEYLAERKIPFAVAQKWLKECYFSVGDRQYFAVYFPNDTGGGEARSKYHKGVIGTKAITTLVHDATPCIHLFEGFMDFLSVLVLQKAEALPGTTIILNGTELLKYAIEHIETHDFQQIHCYFDNDDAGDKALQNLIDQLPNHPILDHRTIFASAKDANDFLIHHA